MREEDLFLYSLSFRPFWSLRLLRNNQGAISLSLILSVVHSRGRAPKIDSFRFSSSAIMLTTTRCKEQEKKATSKNRLGMKAPSFDLKMI